MANPIKDGNIVNDLMFLSPAMANTQVLTGDLTLTDDSPEIQYLDANGANRNVNLPSVANTNHIFFIYNSAAAAFNLVVKSGATTVATITQGQSGLIFSNGATWIAFSTSAGGVKLFDVVASNNLIVTGTTETQFYSKSIPGNTIAALSGLRVVHRLAAVDTANANAILTVNIKMDTVIQFAVSVRISETANIFTIVDVSHYLMPYTAGGNNQIWSLMATSIKSGVLDPTVRMWSSAVASTFDMTAAHTLSATATNQFATGSAYHEFTTVEVLK